MTEQIAIAATFELLPGRYPEENAYGMYQRVLSGALREWQLRPADIDGIFAKPTGVAMNAEMDLFTHERIAEELGIHPRVAECVQAGGVTYGVMVNRAAAAIRDGQAESVLCIGAGKFPKVGAGGAEAMARMVCDPVFEFPYGAYVAAIYALAASQYLAAYGAAREDLAAVAVAARKWALRNPRAVMHKRGELTIEAVLASRPIAAPFNMLDCSFPCEGGGAILVTSGRKARAITSRPAYLLGSGECHTHNAVSQAPSLLTSGAIQSSATAFAKARLQPMDIKTVQFYDAFTINPLLLLEDTGFCARGEAASFVRDGRTEPGGKLPVNTNGGLLSFGHVGDGSGLSVIIEGARQVMRAAGDNQVDSETAFIHTYGGMMAEHVSLILGSAS